jgi:hypothetical protein
VQHTRRRSIKYENNSLGANAQFLDHGVKTGFVGALQIAQQTTTLPNHRQKTATGAEIFFVGGKMCLQNNLPTNG